MALIEDLTKSHVDLEAELTHFQQLLDDIVNGKDRASSIALLKAELTAVDHKLEQHIVSETLLGQRSDEVLGKGSMEDYGVASHHTQLRQSIVDLGASLSGDGNLPLVKEHFGVFMDHFESYTRTEWEFLQANSSVLYPGGGDD